MTPGERAAFARDGYLLLPGFFDLERDIAPLQRDLGALIARVAAVCGEPREAPAAPSAFDSGYLDLAARHAPLQPLVYDMAKTLPPFVRLIGHERIVALYRELRGTELCGTPGGASGIRIDRPGDEERMAPWHQEFPYQFRSLDGVTFWLPLVPVHRELGPVILARGSHRDGIEPIVDEGGSGDDDIARGAYGRLTIGGRERLGERYELVQIDTEPGDLLAFDYLTLHASAPNRGPRARWSAQIRYFNFADAYGAATRWSGGVKHGRSLAEANAALRDAARYLEQ